MTYPFLAVLLFLTLAAAVFARRRWVAGAAAGALILYTWIPANVVAMRWWERPYPAVPPAAGVAADAIVVLAGAVNEAKPPFWQPLLGEHTYERCRYGAWLHETWRRVPVLVSGGEEDPGERAAALVMRDELVRLGVPPEMVWTESGSGSTWENAVQSAALLRSRGITRVVLVTSATHMRRAQATFERQGLVVHPAACCHRSLYDIDAQDVVMPNWRAVQWNDELVHEVAGVVWYWWKGRL